MMSCFISVIPDRYWSSTIAKRRRARLLRRIQKNDQNKRHLEADEDVLTDPPRPLNDHNVWTRGDIYLTLDREGVQHLEERVMTWQTVESLCLFLPKRGFLDNRLAQQRTIRALCNPCCKIVRLSVLPDSETIRESQRFICELIAKAVRRKDSCIKCLHLSHLGIDKEVTVQLALALIDNNCVLNTLDLETKVNRSVKGSDILMAALGHPNCKVRHLQLSIWGNGRRCRKDTPLRVLKHGTSSLRLESISIKLFDATHHSIAQLVDLVRNKKCSIRSLDIFITETVTPVEVLSWLQTGGKTIAAMVADLLDGNNQLETIALNVSFPFLRSWGSLLPMIASPFNNLRELRMTVHQHPQFSELTHAIGDWMKRPQNCLAALELTSLHAPVGWWIPIFNALSDVHNGLVRLRLGFNWDDAEDATDQLEIQLLRCLRYQNTKLREVTLKFVDLRFSRQLRRALFSSTIISFLDLGPGRQNTFVPDQNPLQTFLAETWVGVMMALTSISCISRLARNAACRSLPMLDFICSIAETLGWLKLIRTEPYLRN